MYLLHQPAVVACAVVVMRTTWPIVTKFSVTLVAATALTLAVNEALARVDWLAPAFGRDRRVTRSGGTSAPRSVRPRQLEVICAAMASRESPDRSGALRSMPSFA